MGFESEQQFDAHRIRVLGHDADQAFLLSSDELSDFLRGDLIGFDWTDLRLVHETREILYLQIIDVAVWLARVDHAQIVPIVESYGLVDKGAQCLRSEEYHRADVSMDAQNVPDFAETLASFRHFLEQQGVPRNIVWVSPEQTIYLSREWKVFEGEGIAESTVSALYQAAWAADLGMQLGVLCADDDNSYCYFYAPADSVDAEYTLLGSGCIKLMVPVGVPRASTIERGWLARWYQLKEWKFKKWKNGHFLLS